ncbi:MAG: hypothetical protein KJZ54_10585 [Phycisphaerales bacterium]|nr:hypothetical protein [Phycisphaerales bacterium]
MSRVLPGMAAIGALTAALLPPASAQEAAVGPAPEMLRDFISLAERTLPAQGSVIAVYEPSTTGAYWRTTIGYDAASRAWFLASWRSVLGRDPQGAFYRSDGESALVSDWTTGASVGTLAIADFFPLASVAFLRSNPSAIVSLDRTEDDRWVARFVQPGLESLAPTTIEIDGSGVPLRRWREDPSDRREIVFGYSPESPPGFPLVSGWGSTYAAGTGGVALTHVEFHANGNPALFERSAVENTAIDNRVIVETKRQASAAGFVRNEDGTWNPPDRTKVKPYSGDDLRAYRWPLVLAGLTFVALAGYEIVRRRRGA